MSSRDMQSFSSCSPWDGPNNLLGSALVGLKYSARLTACWASQFRQAHSFCSDVVSAHQNGENTWPPITQLIQYIHTERFPSYYYKPYLSKQKMSPPTESLPKPTEEQAEVNHHDVAAAQGSLSRRGRAAPPEGCRPPWPLPCHRPRIFLLHIHAPTCFPQLLAVFHVYGCCFSAARQVP